MPRAAFQWFYLLFFVSGFPALIYQIVWQRTLFAIYGVNIESVTVVVSAFMLGLGLGSLAGGRISRNPSAPLLLLFGGIELGIAAYGAASLPLFHAVARFTAGAPPLETGLLSFALVLVPTVLMGATLPLLVAQLVKFSGNVGRSVGALYFVNTLGSAVACFVAALVTMRYLGMSGSVAVAAALNILVGSTVLLLHFRWPANPAGDEPREMGTPDCAPMLPFPVAVALAALAGFLSLCYEIVWYRLYSFATSGLAQCFAYVLGAFLAGIAFGSWLSRRICRQATSDVVRLARSISVLVLLASLLGFSIVPLVALAVRHVNYVWTLPLVAVTAGMLGATFPLLCHISVRPDAGAGAGLSYLYLGNIIGSAAGSWVVGFVLMDWFSLRWISVILALLGTAMAMALAVLAGLRGRERAIASAIVSCAAVAIVLASGPLFATAYGQMQYKQEWGQPGTRLADVVETRSGVVTVDEDGAIFGGGAFDGWMTTDVHETDLLLRPLALSFFHPSPKEVLEVGLSGGAWSEIMANHPRIEKQVVIEINPGYVEVVRRYPMVSPLLHNPKVEIVIDDGRRWMLRNRHRRFDVIVMDTIYYWRAHATNLLSVEFLDLARQLLKPGGILYYNTTFSWDAQRTGAEHFPYAFRFGPFMVVSDSPIQIDRERWRTTLLSYRLEGIPILDPSTQVDRDRLNEILARADTLPGNTYVSEGMETRENILRRTRGRRIVTDDNMATEWRQ
ncbi:MAG: spermidine synthase [Acidobacteriia bacterium]|nr:spermidine synthase [Terriglobia bacterium]